MPEQIAYTADRLFTGEAWLEGQAVLLQDGLIGAILPLSQLPSSCRLVSYPGCRLVPAFIDLQIYGAEGKLLAVYPEASSLFSLESCNAKGGTAYCLPAVATNTPEVFYQCIDAVRDYWRLGGQGILGLHLEGPWINPAKRGAHIESLIHAPGAEEVTRLLDHGEGVIKMITLAPEVCSREVIEQILSRGIVISAGHSNASYQEAMQGFENGIRAVTHLYNAMSPLHHREPGLVGAAMDHDTVMASIIPDGHHVDYAAIRIAKQVMKARLFAITDAVTDTDRGHYRHTRAGDKYESGGILSGSSLTMNQAVSRLVQFAGIDEGEALRMCSLYPARVLGMEDRAGLIKPGFRAALTVINPAWEVKELIRPRD